MASSAFVAVGRGFSEDSRFFFLQLQLFSVEGVLLVSRIYLLCCEYICIYIPQLYARNIGLPIFYGS